MLYYYKLRLALTLHVVFSLFCYLEDEEKQKKQEEKWKNEIETAIEEKAKQKKESEQSTKTIVIIVVVSVLLVAGAVTGYAYQQKILCFAESTNQKQDEKEATGDKSPLLKKTAFTNQVSPSQTTTATSATALKNANYSSKVSGSRAARASASSLASTHKCADLLKLRFLAIIEPMSSIKIKQIHYFLLRCFHT